MMLIDQLAKFYSVRELEDVYAAIHEITKGRPAMAMRCLSRVTSKRERASENRERLRDAEMAREDAVELLEQYVAEVATAGRRERCQPTPTSATCCLPAGHEGPHRFKCAGEKCPGLIWPASIMAHPSTCVGGEEEGVR